MYVICRKHLSTIFLETKDIYTLTEFRFLSRVECRGSNVEGQGKKSRVRVKKVEGEGKKSRVEICGQNSLFNVVTWTYRIYVCRTTLTFERYYLA